MCLPSLLRPFVCTRPVFKAHALCPAILVSPPPSRFRRHTSSMTATPSSPAAAAAKPAKSAPMDPFAGLDIRVGRILAADPFPEARKPAIKLTLDLGPELGTKKSSAQIVKHYGSTDEERAKLVGTLVLAVCNLPPRQIGKFMSQVLVVGVPDENGDVVLVRPDTGRQGVVVGGKLY
ncbi:hypothetical protein BCR44DRAFT_1441067 [Catenaria anguillulae PL171]|uniref:tRNA-binding domain-containing protein n=1 Tax=Catenaria anguillulae PL171 TaxID=765915 RepID=A0A1Y2HBX2_9FUNG|nr:hypothetical protein BCR44DRAFT_1441067 [Catenaria anguillulae PL171]